jgi:hypothetical protein
MIALMYRSFGRTPPASPGAAVWLLALAFVVSSVAMLAVFNFFSLFFGVFVNFLGRDGVKFTFLHLFRRIPMIGIAPLVLIGYAIWQNVELSGGWSVVMMPVATAVAAVMLIGGTVMINSLRSRR